MKIKVLKSGMYHSTMFDELYLEEGSEHHVLKVDKQIGYTEYTISFKTHNDSVEINMYDDEVVVVDEPETNIVGAATSKVEIQNLRDDSYDCEDCGGGLGAYGYRIFVDGKMVVEREPHDHCCSPVSYGQREMAEDLLSIVAKMNAEVSFRDGEGF